MSFDGLFDDLEAHGTVRFILTGVKVRTPHDVVLVMKHAGHGNTAYLNGRRKIEAAARARSGPLSGADFLEAFIPLFAKTVITGWEHVAAADGKPTPATAEQIEAFLTTLARKAPDLVEQALAFAIQPGNFRDTPTASAEALGNG